MRRALPPGAPQPKREPVAPEQRPPLTTGRVATPPTIKPAARQRAAAPGGRAVAPSPDAQPVTPTHPQRPTVEPKMRARDRHRLTLTVT